MGRHMQKVLQPPRIDFSVLQRRLDGAAGLSVVAAVGEAAVSDVGMQFPVAVLQRGEIEPSQAEAAHAGGVDEGAAGG